ncbi:hypothetical protein S2E19_01707 [Bacillus mycoides]|nr:hypothetical protein S2E19_01707 [Bacillus mycoides]
MSASLFYTFVSKKTSYFSKPTYLKRTPMPVLVFLKGKL